MADENTKGKAYKVLVHHYSGGGQYYEVGEIRHIQNDNDAILLMKNGIVLEIKDKGAGVVDKSLGAKDKGAGGK